MENTKTMLLNENKNTLRFLHDAAGFDFEKEYLIIKGSGRFTFNSVNQAIKNEIGNTIYKAVILFTTEGGYCDPHDIYYAEIGLTRFNAERIDGIDYWFNHKDNEKCFDYCYGIGNFEEKRKNYIKDYYIIAQNKDYILPCKQKHKTDYSERFKPGENYHNCGDGQGHEWINDIELIETVNSGFKTEYHFDYYYSSDYLKMPKTIYAVMDKSGYLLDKRRNELKRKAAALKADRDNKAATSADFTGDELLIESGINNAKSFIAEMIIKCTDGYAMYDLQTNMRALYNAMVDYKQYQEKKNNHSFTSIENIEYYISDIKNDLNKALTIKDGE